MNKKLFLGMFAAASMLLATSCQNDELDGAQSGKEATVSFNLGVETVVGSRAISDGKKAKKLVYAVYDANGELLKVTGSNPIGQFEDKDAFKDGLEHEVTITLAKGQTYTVAFWAQNNACGAYNTADLKNVTVSYEDADNNDETRDAFFAAETFTVTGHTSIDVTMKRPFAQINVGVTNYDWDAAKNSGIDIQTSKVVIKNAATSINLLDGSVSGEADVTYDFAATPKSSNEVLSVDLNGDGTAESYNYLSMSYILVNDANGGANKTTLQDLDFTFRPTSGNDIVFGEGLNSVPVQRNWRTNIIGQILTGNITFNIKIDPIYDGEYDLDEDANEVKVYNVRLRDKLYTTIEDALADAVSGDVINLAAGSFDLPSKLYVGGTTAEADITLVGTGENTVLNALTPSQTDRPSTYADNHGITIKDLKYVTKNDWLRAGFAHAKYVKFENCTIEGGYHCFAPVETFTNCTIDPQDDFIYTYGSSNTTFEGCTFNSSKGNAIQAYSEGFDNELYLTIKDCEFTAAQAGKDQWYNGPITAVEISSIRGNKFIVDITNTTATGYSTGTVSGNCLWNWRDNSADGNYKGTESAYVTIDGNIVFPPITLNSTAYATLAEALAAAVDNDVITIASGTYEVPAGGGGKTLTFIGSDAANVTFKLRPNGDAHHDGAFRGSKITFENLTLEADPNLTQYSGYGHCEGTYKKCVIKNVYTLYGTSVFEDCTFEVTGNKYNVWTWGASAEFNKCTFNCDGKAVLVYGETAQSSITFNDCVFNDNNGDPTVSGKAAIEVGSHPNVEKYDIFINRCTANGFDINTEGVSTNTKLWGNKNSMEADKLNVVIDGVDVL